MPRKRAIWTSVADRQMSLYWWGQHGVHADRVEMGIAWFTTDECWALEAEQAEKNRIEWDKELRRREANKAEKAAKKAAREARAQKKTEDRAAKEAREIAEGKRDECQICHRHQALRNGVLVDHGYQRPGCGWLVGGCFGVAYRPFPQTEALEAYVPKLEGYIAQCAEKAVAESVTLSTEIGKGKYVGRKYVLEVVAVRSLEEFVALADDPRCTSGQRGWFNARRYELRVEGYRNAMRKQAEDATLELGLIKARIAEGQRLQKEGA